MATYKVLQDIEAEDKFLGPLTLKQCIFAAIAIVGGYLSYILLSRGIWVMVMPLVPVIIVTGFLAFPWGRDQPTEVWLLAKLRFMFKPRKRVWDQSGIQELVHITAPPSVEQFTGDNLSQTEVKSRLRALADTIDSRGWAIKGASGQPTAIQSTTSSDRLVGPSMLPSVSLSNDELQVADIFENTLASDISSKISASSSQHRQEAVSTMQQSAQEQVPDAGFWFMNQPSSDDKLTNFGTQTQQPQSKDDSLSPLFNSRPSVASPNEASFLNELKHKKDLLHQDFRNHKTIAPHSAEATTPPVTPPAAPATISLARNNDRTVDSLAREAGGDEVVVPLH